MRVRQIMTRDPVTVAPETELKRVAALLTAHGISGVPVVEGEEVVGVVSTSDIVGLEQRSEAEALARRRWRRRRAERPARTVRAAMTSPAVTVHPLWSAVGAAWLMSEHDVGRLPVVDRGRLVGIVTRSDLVRAFARADEEIRSEILGELLTVTDTPASDVEVLVDGGVVRLRGTVEDELDAQALPQAVRAVVGVVDVEAELTARTSRRAAEDLADVL